MTQPDVPAPLAAMVEAINAADTDAFVAAFTEDGFVDDWGTRLQGRDGVRQWAETDAIGRRARMEVLEARTEGSTTTIRFDWRSEKFNGESTGIAEVEGDRLAGFTIPPAR